ncbi:MAG: PaaI family thioesterase [Pseudomonadales bacterium]|nr:PaaI family thioesterase [Pseudomonadales bacterium]
MSEGKKDSAALTSAGSRFLRGIFDVKMSVVNEEVEGEIVFHERHEGPPGHAHGGSIATVMDELMGCAAFMKGYMALAAHLELDYRKPVPLHIPLIGKTQIIKEGNRSVHVKGQLHREDNGQLLVESSAVFVHIGGSKFMEMNEEGKPDQKLDE